MERFSFAQLTSNSDGKTSGSGTAGLYIVFIGGVCFFLGCVDKMFLDGRDKKIKHIPGDYYNQQILNQIRSNCYFYVHGHSAGGTNPSLVEAMFLELPIIAYSADYNKETTHFKANYFETKDDLILILKNLHKAELEKNGASMKEIADENYTWKLISEKYKRLF